MSAATQAVAPIDTNPASFQLRGGAFTLIVLRLNDPKDPGLFAALADKVAQAPNFFRHAPVVVDLQNLVDAPPFNIAELGRRLRQHQLILIGVQNGTEEQNHAAANAGLSIFREGRQTPLRVEPSLPTRASPMRPVVTQAPPALAAAKLVTSAVRSGRQVYAHASDLVVLASISPGAELLADGHIHVYGALRGRALAGVSGDTTARIFCHSLEAELISIAGFWRVRDDLPDDLVGKPVQIFLEGERIVIEPLA